ncbi:MAG TPA: MaoC family dehydratase N-terminal domain-containing protein [Acidimicrobiales bacterium]
MEADETETEAFRRKLDGLVGTQVGSASIGPDPVNQPMIRHWAAAFEDENPVYTDSVVAASTRFGEVVAPPLMLQSWTMATPKITGIAERGGSPVELTETSPLSVFDDAGFVGTLASNTEFDIERYLRIGDTVSATTFVESISARKQTRIGPGYFVTWVTTYTDGSGALVGRQRFRILKFRPEARS